MVWFQCEDCGEEIKKPKLNNHFRLCSAGKLSCLDCGERFSQQTVQGHTQCITEAEKYGPKGQAKSPQSAQPKTEKPKKNADVDIHVGLSSRAPWFCSLCNVTTTSRQTLLAHADGKKHKAKARAYHASQNKKTQVDEQPENKGNLSENTNHEADRTHSEKSPEGTVCIKVDSSIADVENGNLESKKRKHNAQGENEEENVHLGDTNGNVAPTNSAAVPLKPLKKQKIIDSVISQNGHDKDGHNKEDSKKKVKWKKLVTSVLKSDPEGVLRLKKLQKLVIKALKESGISENKAQLREKLLDKINTSSRFVIEGKFIRVVAKEVPS